MPNDAAAGNMAIRTVLRNVGYPGFAESALEQACRDPLLRGIHAGSESLQIHSTSLVRRDIHTGVGLALMAIDLCRDSKDSSAQAGTAPDFMPEHWGEETQGSVTRPGLEDEISSAGSSVMLGIIRDTRTDAGAYRARLNTALEQPLYKGIFDGFRALMPWLLGNGMPEDSMSAVHRGLDLALMAASAPYEMLSASEVPEPSAFT